jgi:hypothetical protein
MKVFVNIVKELSLCSVAWDESKMSMSVRPPLDPVVDLDAWGFSIATFCGFKAWRRMSFVEFGHCCRIGCLW